MESKEKEVVSILKENPSGMTITLLVKNSDFSRSTVRTILAKLEGGGKVKIREGGMAKLYSLK